MGVGKQLIDLQHLAAAAVDGAEDPRPVISRSGAKGVGDPLAEGRPFARVVLRVERHVADAQRLEERRVEARLDCSDGKPPSVGALVGAVERGGAAERAPAPPLPLAVAELSELRRQQQGGTIDHRRVDDLTPAGSLAFEQRKRDADHRHERTAGEVADDVEWRDWLAVANGSQRSGDGDVVDVVADAVRGTARAGPSR